MCANFINDLSISHFKSIDEIQLKPKRINVFIGRPNVGKSNILEALSMFCLPYGFNKELKSGIHPVSEEFIRYEIMKDFFHFSDVTRQIEIRSNVGSLVLKQLSFHYQLIIGASAEEIKELNELTGNSQGLRNKILQSTTDSNNGNVNPLFLQLSNKGEASMGDLNYQTFIKRYSFKRFTSAHEEKINPFTGFLTFPYGDNLFALIQTHPKIREIANEYFEEYNLDFVLRHRENTFEIQRRLQGSVDAIPFSLTADTLQRMIFYKAAILSNNGSVLLFEEPESHTFPKYIDDLGELIINDDANQYFITTHSPYLIQSLLKKQDTSQIALFIVDYENYKTTLQMLDDDAIQQIYDEGVDLFFNVNAFGQK